MMLSSGSSKSLRRPDAAIITRPPHSAQNRSKVDPLVVNGASADAQRRMLIKTRCFYYGGAERIIFSDSSPGSPAGRQTVLGVSLRKGLAQGANGQREPN